ncbi:MAG: hypothetical protein M3P11_11315 [Actinomycetota bacterium]|nr:hypothetical protein [Actinomycetota bacterium]
MDELLRTGSDPDSGEASTPETIVIDPERRDETVVIDDVPGGDTTASGTGWGGFGARRGLGVFGGFFLLSILIYALPVITHLGSRCVGLCLSDPKLYLWMFRWMPYALHHRLDPFSTPLLWAPAGADLTWVTTLWGPALIMSPITLLFGPLAATNLLAIAAPALAGWAAYLMCSRVTRNFWASVGGAAIFGFSTYIGQHMRFQLNLLLIFFFPLAVYLVLRRLDGSLSKRMFVVLMAAVLVGIFSDSTELFATMTMFGAMALIGAIAFGPAENRPALLSTVRLIGIALGVTLILLVPFLIEAFRHVPESGLRPLDKNSADLLSFVIPRHTMLFGGLRFTHATYDFPSLGHDDTAYLGPGIILLLLLFAWTERKRRATWLLLGFAGVAGILAMGPSLHIGGTPSIPLPGAIVAKLPLIQESLPERYPAYAWLAIAAMAAIFLTRARGWNAVLRFALVIAALVFLLPAQRGYHGTLVVPTFFSDGEYRNYIAPGEIILPIGAHLGDDLVWQAAADMDFRMTRGYLGPSPPPNAAGLGLVLSNPTAHLPTVAKLIATIEVDHVGAIVAAAPVSGPLDDMLQQATGSIAVITGGVAFYRVEGRDPSITAP